jgi:hypothetical protein
LSQFKKHLTGWDKFCVWCHVLFFSFKERQRTYSFSFCATILYNIIHYPMSKQESNSIGKRPEK